MYQVWVTLCLKCLYYCPSQVEDVDEEDNLNALDMNELDKLAGNMSNGNGNDEDKEEKMEEKDSGNFYTCWAVSGTVCRILP